MIIGVDSDILKSNHRFYYNMKHLLEQSERLKKPSSQNFPRMRVELNISAPSPYEKTFGIEALSRWFNAGEETIISVPSSHDQHNLGDKISSVYKCTSVKQCLGRARIAAHEGD